jgi:hypothetical protein
MPAAMLPSRFWAIIRGRKVHQFRIPSEPLTNLYIIIPRKILLSLATQVIH